MSVHIKANSPFYLRGVLISFGQVVKADPIDAAAIVYSGKADFCNDQDQDACRDAIRRHDERVCPPASTIRPLFKVKG